MNNKYNPLLILAIRKINENILAQKEVKLLMN